MLTLKIFLVANGKWAGLLYDAEANDDEGDAIFCTGGYASPEALERAVTDSHTAIEAVVIHRKNEGELIFRMTNWRGA